MLEPEPLNTGILSGSETLNRNIPENERRVDQFSKTVKRSTWKNSSLNRQ